MSKIEIGMYWMVSYGLVLAGLIIMGGLLYE
jgi:hypothetical protein